MKKLYSRKLAVALALASLFGVKPASGLNNFAKLGISVALVGLVGGGGFLIHHLLKKESSNGDGGKKLSKINPKDEYYNYNIKIIESYRKQVNESCINKLISFINSKNNDFLGEIVYIPSGGEHYFKNFNGFSYNGLKWRGHWIEINEGLIKKVGLSKGNSWVEEFFDKLRGGSKIINMEFEHFFDSDNLFRIFFDDKVYSIRFMTEEKREVLEFTSVNTKDYSTGRQDRYAVYLVGKCE